MQSPKGTLQIRKDAFEEFSKESEWGKDSRVPGVFCERFEKAGWDRLP